MLTNERISEIVASTDRSAADLKNDIRRKPKLTLAFIGIHSGMVALDINAGGGYTTELIARAVGPKGRVYGQSPPRNADAPQRAPVTPEGNSASASSSIMPPQLTLRLTSPQALLERAKNPLVSLTLLR